MMKALIMIIVVLTLTSCSKTEKTFDKGVGDTKVKVGDLKILLDDRGPSDLTRRIDELEKENKTLQEKLSKLQKLMFDQFRNKGDM